MSENGDAARGRLLELLDAAAGASAPVAFWWRDDDARETSPALDRLLRLASSRQVRLGLAVIPEGASGMLAASVAPIKAITVLQHGWSHHRHSPENEKKAELGDHRPVGEVIAELAFGRRRLTDMFGERFLPVLVPPWNRIGPMVRTRRGEAGLPGLSVFGRAQRGERHVVNTHVDLIDWTVRRSVSRAQAYALLAREVELRVAGDPEPIGLLTHHLVHDEAGWLLLEELLALLVPHPGTRWPRIDALFALRPVDPPSG